MSNLNAFLNSVRYFVPFGTLDELVQHKWFYREGHYVSSVLNDVRKNNIEYRNHTKIHFNLTLSVIHYLSSKLH